jgi:bifunctional non-homologous end joining protein LigD
MHRESSETRESISTQFAIAMRRSIHKKRVSTDERQSSVVGSGGRIKSDYAEVLGVRLSHPDRIIFEDTGMTKGALAEYYAAAMPWILKDIAGHPVTLVRCPQGASHNCFYQRNLGAGLGPDVKPFRWKHKGRSYEYLYVEDGKGVIEFVQMGAIELHPWGARADSIDYPDRLIFDLDPDEAVPFEVVKRAALDLRRRLATKGIHSFLKCTGGKGLHVTAPLAAKDTWDTVKSFAAKIANEMVGDTPDAYVANMRKIKRKGKIFVDYFRNDYTATAIADFSVRVRPGAPVAVPLEWRELGRLESAHQFTVSDVLKRLARWTADPDRYNRRQRIPP